MAKTNFRYGEHSASMGNETESGTAISGRRKTSTNITFLGNIDKSIFSKYSNLLVFTDTCSLYTQDTSNCEILCDSSFSFSKHLKVSNSQPYCEFSKVLRMEKSIA